MPDWKHKIVENVNTTHKTELNYLNNFLIVFAVVATIFVAYMFFNVNQVKNNYQDISYVNPGNFNDQFKFFNNTPVNSFEQDISILKYKYNELDSYVKELFKRSVWSMDRQRLISILWNHNTMVIKTNGYTNDLILINGDWTIDRMPWLVALTNDDKEFLNRFLKK